MHQSSVIRRARALVMVACLVAASVLLAACSSGLSASSQNTAVSDQSKSPTRHVVYVQVLKTLTVGAANLGEEAANARAKQLGNITLQVVGPPTADPAQQVQLIEGAISKHVDGLIVSALDSSVCTAVDEAMAAGIPTITFDSGCPGSKQLTFVGTDNYAGGVAAGELYAAAVKGKGPQRIAILTGVPGASNLADRDRGFKDALKKAGVNFTIVQTISGNDDVNQSVDVTEAFLRGHPDVNGFYFDGPWPLLVKPANIPLTVQRAKQGMTIVSFDTIQPEMDALRSHLVIGLVGQDYYGMSYQAVQVLDQIVRHGGKFGPNTTTPLVIVTLNGGPTAAGMSVSAAQEDQRWTTNDWPESPIVAPNNQ